MPFEEAIDGREGLSRTVTAMNFVANDREPG
jgi:hypothetical protein